MVLRLLFLNHLKPNRAVEKLTRSNKQSPASRRRPHSMSRLHSHQIRLHSCLQYTLLGFLKSPFGERTQCIRVHRGQTLGLFKLNHSVVLRVSSGICRLWILTLFLSSACEPSFHRPCHSRQTISVVQSERVSGASDRERILR